jgi:hypothetical protein
MATPKKKHDWNNHQNHLDVHEKVLRTYDSNFRNTPSYKLSLPTPQYLEMSTTIYLNHKNLKLEIEKILEINDNGRQPVSRTHSYSYNVSDSVGNFFRYCSPHDAPGPAHHAHHHKHEYDSVTRRELARSPTLIPVDGYPHINEVIEEALRL